MTDVERGERERGRVVRVRPPLSSPSSCSAHAPSATDYLSRRCHDHARNNIKHIIARNRGSYNKKKQRERGEGGGRKRESLHETGGHRAVVMAFVLFGYSRYTNIMFRDVLFIHSKIQI